MLKNPCTTRKDAWFDVSVIIPTNHSHQDLIDLTLMVCNQSAPPAEIIIIDSSHERGNCPLEIQQRCVLLKIDLTYKAIDQAYPGRARNVGINHSKHKHIAFIDVRTIPRSDWLAVAKTSLVGSKVSGIWGRTNFEAATELEKLTRDGFFGRNARRTLPGTVLCREALAISGQFVGWVRAGEDSDWMQRIYVSRLKFLDPPDVTLDYQGLLNQDIISLARKWSRNYSSARILPQLFLQKSLIWFTFYPYLVLLALNWNNLLAGWEIESIFYIPNVTKVVAASPALIYILFRGIVLPLRRGVPLGEVLPFRWLAIATICSIGDGAKAVAFLRPEKTRPVKP